MNIDDLMQRVSPNKDAVEVAREIFRYLIYRYADKVSNAGTLQIATVAGIIAGRVRTMDELKGLVLAYDHLGFLPPEAITFPAH